MSEGHVLVVRLGRVGRVPNSDALSITTVFDYPVIFRTGEFAEGDLATFVPIDSIMPDEPRWTQMLGDSRRVRMKKLRGVPSRGLLLAAPPGTVEGQEVRELLGITRYVPPVELDTRGQTERPPPIDVPVYDVEGLLRWRNVLQSGEEVLITEKIHGANGRWVFHDGQLFCGSRGQFKKEDPKSIWWSAATTYELSEKLAKYPGIVVFGEVYGQVQDLKYGVPSGVRIAVFDMYDSQKHRWFEHFEIEQISVELGLPLVPVLYRGPWSVDLKALSEGQSTLAGHVREGFVVKSIPERIDVNLGRVILKLVGEGYHLRKEKT